MEEGPAAARLVALGRDGLVVARSEPRAARLHRAAAALAPAGMQVILLPGWDVLPYDRVPPSAGIAGRRAAALAALAARASGPRLLILSVEAAMQRIPRHDPASWLDLRPGQETDPPALRDRLLALGYREDDRVDEPGEVALHGAVLDLCPGFAPGDPAWRIRVEGGRIAAILRFDPASQRSLEELEAIAIGPAAEGTEGLVPPLGLLPDASLWLDAEVEERAAVRAAEIREAFRLRLASGAAPRPPDELYLPAPDWRGGQALDLTPPADPQPPRFAGQPDPDRAFLRHVRAALASGRRVALAGGQGRGARRLAARLGDALPVDGWPGLLAAPPGSLALLRASPGPEPFAMEGAEVIPFAAIRPGAAAAGRREVLSGGALQPGDAVIHLDHGLGALRGVETLEAAGARMDCLRLDYAGGTAVLVPMTEMDRLWRYGAEAAGVTLDRPGGEAWPKRRAAAEREAEATAARLLAALAEREAARAPALVPPAAALARLEAGFAFEPTPDQAAAIADTLADLARERPMDRLVCGDVGFGKTEVALRAAGAAALAGKQVAVLAPTTVLVRQHLEGFRRRLAPLGLRVEALSRLTPPAEARAIRAAIAAGEVQVAIGTQALAAASVRFRDLGLVVVDEEQRFGARQKAALGRLGAGQAVHRLTLTATPIPQTLATALIGLRDLSVIATPPLRRQPVRTLRGTRDDAALVQALRREVRRGGQGFVVCPRIEDVEPLRARIADLAPELSLISAHGGQRPEEMDEAMIRFADGGADVLVSTNIVEAGLDVPRANTMVVCHADRFGLSQLHQLRGRVGRGRARGVFWLLTEPGQRLSPVTERRLRALEAMDRIGAGFAISARDLDLRGAGELLGEAQAGHLKLVGMELQRELLDQAMARARGAAPPERWTPKLELGLDAFIPEGHVPTEALQVEIHARLGRILREADAAALDALEEEVEDRFGPMPEPLANLFALARLALRCRALEVTRLEAGPQAAAATPRRMPDTPPPALEAKGERLILRRPGVTPAARLAAAEALLDALEGA